MSAKYTTVIWNRQKRRYDGVILVLVVLFLAVFIGLQLSLFPEITGETLIIRATGTLAFLLLHLILVIGPLARINRRFLPLLYNRRHLGVLTFLIGAVHGGFNVIQFHSLGNTDPLLSVFTANPAYGSLLNFPFQILGFFALMILFVMAATSHDFWLKNLGPRAWKRLHMGVYIAYTLLVAHVMLGVIQLESSEWLVGLVGVGLVSITGLHVWAGQISRTPEPSKKEPPLPEGFYPVARVEDIPEDRAKILLIKGENIAVFKYDGKISAVNNICRHQHGPLGEGKIVDGCITCPWHGYQYYPHNGQSPPPFTEKIETYDVRVIDGMVYVHPQPYPEGTERPPASLPSSNSLQT